MKYTKTNCSCCANTLEACDDHLRFEISRWTNFDLALWFEVIRYPICTDVPVKTYSYKTVYRFVVAFWTFKLTLTGNDITFVPTEDQQPKYDERDWDLGHNGGIIAALPSLKFGGVGGSMSMHFTGFCCDGNYETCISTDFNLALPWLGAVCVYYFWMPKSRRKHDVE